MLFPPFLISLLKIIYRIEESNYTRDRPFSILAVGLSRSGTDSLRTALKTLGYDETHHAFVFLGNEIGQGPQLARLIWRKYHTDPSLTPSQRGLDAKEFDKAFGHCMAATDVFCAAFAVELIKAYPDAKVIVNRREDVEAWYESVLKSFDNPKIPSPLGQWKIALFDPELFWIKVVRSGLWEHMFDYAFWKTGKEVYPKHYAEIENVLEQERLAGRERQVLRWQVQDGWEPLVKFLDLEAPEDSEGKTVEFPHSNTPTELQKRRLGVAMDKVQRANRRRRIFVCAVAGVIVGTAGWWWKTQ